jgi:hypothetical protein
MTTNQTATLNRLLDRVCLWRWQGRTTKSFNHLVMASLVKRGLVQEQTKVEPTPFGTDYRLFYVLTQQGHDLVTSF